VYSVIFVSNEIYNFKSFLALDLPIISLAQYGLALSLVFHTMCVHRTQSHPVEYVRCQVCSQFFGSSP